ncbi:Rpn family recombination-promoting nuclease/putative transposase [Metabacillus idriensis]|uniref:Rpn family recombination-promoting nuclease/putative transposase n=1 Tax=Metabacillus idriensis TaxID=324768 RepID=UPI001CD72E51|nr:Rpn family recombination-promoting nuclease/putative transposase [Metabacillus idriensis]
MKRLKPLNDFVFKKLFGENKDKDLLIGFLNAVLKNDVQDLYIVEEKLNKEKIDDKQGILDIKAVCYTGEKINIEVQLANEYNMKERTLFYWSKLFAEDFKAAEKYSDLNKTITINILGFNYLEDIESYHSSYKIYEDKTQKLLTDLLEIHFIEMPKFDEMKADLHNPLHRWLLFLREDTVKQPNLEEVFILDQLVAKAEDKLRRLSADEETIRMYQLREKFISDQKTQIEGAKNEKAIEIAKSLLKIPSMSVQDVANHTGLSVQKVREIEREVR